MIKMNMKIKKGTIILLLVFPLISGLVCTVYAEEIISLKWKHDMDNMVSAVTVAEIDGQPTIILGSLQEIHVLDYGGKLRDSYSIDHPGSVYVITVADIDNDGKEEILFGTGYIESTRVNRTYFEFEKEVKKLDKVLSRTTKAKGSVYVIDDGRVEELGDVEEWVRSIYVSDVYKEGDNLAVVGSGGYNLKVYMEKQDRIFKYRLNNVTNYTVVGSITNKTGCEEYCESHGWDFGTCYIECDDRTDCVWNDKEEECWNVDNWTVYWANETGLFWNETEYPQYLGKIRLLTSEGECVSEYTTENASISYAYPFDLALGGSEEVIFASGSNITVLDTLLNETVDQYNTSGDVMKVVVCDIDQLGVDDLVVSYMAETTSGVEVITGQKRKLWSHRVPLGETLRDTHLLNLSENNTGFILATDSTLYALEFRGIQPIWVYSWGYDIRDVYKIFPKDLDGDNVLDIVVLSGNSAYAYELNETFVKNQIAQSYYDSAEKLLDSDPIAALDYANKAKDIYTETGNRDQLNSIEYLIIEIENEVKKAIKAEADFEYGRAVANYKVNNTKSLEYAISARDLYSQVDNLEGIQRCDDLMKKIDPQVSTLPETTSVEIITTSTLATTSTTTGGVLPDLLGGWELLLVALLILIPLALIILMKKAARKGEGG